ncbi:MAG: ABC transporter permease [Oscillospiraceae bacterium]|nr:ABC transporter permease [Oscillospiraceae bacterium]
MRKYLIKRFAYLVVVFFVVSLMMYAIYNLIPSDPALVQMEPLRKTLKPDEWTAQYLQLRTKLGLDQPLLVRYARWMGFMKDVDGTFSGLLQGNFGYSVSYKRPVVDIIGTPMLNTILLNFISTILTLAITIPLGIYCAVHARSAGDSAIQAGTVVGYSLPTYLVGILFIYIFAVLLRWLPTGGAKTPGSTYTGTREFLDRLYYMALPVLVLVFTGLAGMTRTVRAAMMDTLSQDYIRTARAKGLREKVVVYSHAWRNALLPVSTSIMGWMISVFTGGSLVIETTFSLNGTGRLYWSALNTTDYELVLAMQMFYTLVSLVGVLLTDLSYTLVDPRVRIDK